MPPVPTYHSQHLDHLGPIAGMWDDLGVGVGEVLDAVIVQQTRDRQVTTTKSTQKRTKPHKNDERRGHPI